MVVAAARGERFAVDGPAGEPAALERQLREGAAAAAAASDAPPAAAPPAWDVVRLNPGVSLGPVMTKQHTKARTNDAVVAAPSRTTTTSRGFVTIGATSPPLGQREMPPRQPLAWVVD
jgi:hypothetical protein